MLVLVGFGLRGSIGRRPLQEKDIATTGDVLINKLVPNPFFALYTAIQNHLTLETSAGIRSFLPDGDVRAAARALFPARREAADLDASLERRAPGGVEPRADHVFVVVMESYDSWSMQPKFASLHLTDRLAALARERDPGARVRLGGKRHDQEPRHDHDRPPVGGPVRELPADRARRIADVRGRASSTGWAIARASSTAAT